MNLSVNVACPDCGHSERAHIGPLLSIGASFSITVDEVSCSECGYEGPAEGV